MFDAMAVRSLGRFSTKYVVFALIGAMMAYVLYHNERFLIEPMNPVWEHYRSLGLFLLAHGLAGGSALILAPMQFSERLRTRFTKLHRVTGRIYVTAALILAPVGAYVQYLDESLARFHSGHRGFRRGQLQSFAGSYLTSGIPLGTGESPRQ